MPEASPDPTPTTPPTPPAPAPTPPARPARDVTPRRFSMVALVALGGVLIAVVLTLAVLAGDDGSSPLLQNLGVDGDVRAVLYGFLNVLYFIFGIGAVIGALVGGFRMATSLGDQRETHRGRKTLMTSLAVIGVLVVSYVLIYRLIGPVTPSVPPARFTIVTVPEQLEGSVPFRVRFTATSSYPPEAQYAWDFGDETSATAADVTHTYQQSGTFTARLTILVNGEAVERAERIVTVDAANPEARIFIDPPSASGAAPLTVTFDGSGSKPGQGAGSELQYAWDFGDDLATPDNPNVDTRTRTTHRFSREGTYTVTLTVTDDQRKTGSVTQEIVVTRSPDDPVARIVAAGLRDPDVPGLPPVVSGIVPLTVSFSGATSESPNGSISEYGWNFGDGSADVRGRAATRTFSQPGTYLVTLTVTDEVRKSGSTQVEVRALPKQKAPVAKIETVPPANDKALLGTAPFLVVFSGAGSVDEDGRVISWDWDFGDGTVAQGERVEHTYVKPGTYIAKLVATDDADNASTPEVYTVKVVPRADAPLAAQITTVPAPAQGVRPLLVEFDGSGSTGTDILNYRWDFGDGTPVVATGAARESHLYETPGVYTVRLTITTSRGQIADTSIAVSVREPAVKAVIEADRLVAAVNQQITFKGEASLGSVTTWRWDFGDGTTDTGRQVTKRFGRQGFFTVKLIVTDASNRTDQATVRVEIQ